MEKYQNQKIAFFEHFCKNMNEHFQLKIAFLNEVNKYSVSYQVKTHGSHADKAYIKIGKWQFEFSYF